MNPFDWMALDATIQGIVLFVLWQPHRRVLMDPPGFDPSARRCHDGEPQPNGNLLHFSTCWCRRG